MSTAKHKSYRKVLAIEHHTCKVGTLDIKATIVVWCVPIPSARKHFVKTEHVAVSCYIGSKHTGVSARFPKAISIKLSDIYNAKYFKAGNLNRMRNAAYTEALNSYLDSIKEFKGVVLYFNKNRGEGMIRCHITGREHMVYGCNLKGSKTGYAETSCVYLEQGTEVVFSLSNGFVIGIPGIFDTEKWNSLDQSKLAFRMNEDRQFINGLFA